MSSTQIVSLWIAWLVLIPQAVFAQGIRTEIVDPKPKVEMLVAMVLVNDPDNHPVEGAIVYSEWIRAEAVGDSLWIFWPEEQFGPLPKVTTDKQGMARVPYPKFASAELKTTTLYLNVEHPDFVSFLENRDVADNPAEVNLKRGFRVALSAIEATTENKIKTDLYAVMSGSNSENWKLFDNGMLVSPNFEPQRRQLRVMRISPGQPNLFSSNIDITPGDDRRILLKDIKLSLGTRVEGRLDESVPRPIQNGHVAAAIVRVSESRPGDLERKWTWTDDTRIAEDGTFVFESLPAGEVLQMIAICDGYVPKQPLESVVMEFFPDDAKRLKGNRTMPHLVSLAGGTVTTTIMMEKATSLRVLAQSPGGRPLAGVEIVMIPNQEWFQYGTSVLGAATRTEKVLVANRKGNDKYEYENPFTAKTNAQGIAVIDNLPPNRLESLRATHESFELPISDFGYRTTNVNIVEGEINEVTIQMKQKETETTADNND